MGDFYDYNIIFIHIYVHVLITFNIMFMSHLVEIMKASTVQ